MKTLSQEEFASLAKGLPFVSVDLRNEIVYVEAISADYFRSAARQKCIVKRVSGDLAVSFYD